MDSAVKRCIVEKLKRINWEGIGASLVIVHGSILWSRNPRDVDMVVIPRDGVDAEELVLRIMEVVEKVLGLEVDLYMLTDPSDTNCFLLLEALRRGIIVYQDSYGREILVKAINICNDFILARRFVRYTETIVEKVMKGASRETS